MSEKPDHNDEMSNAEEQTKPKPGNRPTGGVSIFATNPGLMGEMQNRLRKQNTEEEKEKEDEGEEEKEKEDEGEEEEEEEGGGGGGGGGGGEGEEEEDQSESSPKEPEPLIPTVSSKPGGDHKLKRGHKSKSEDKSDTSSKSGATAKLTKEPSEKSKKKHSSSHKKSHSSSSSSRKSSSSHPEETQENNEEGEEGNQLSLTNLDKPSNMSEKHDHDEDISSSEKPKKLTPGNRPTGGVSIFGKNPDLMGEMKNRLRSQNTEEKEDDQSGSSPTKPEPVEPAIGPKPTVGPKPKGSHKFGSSSKTGASAESPKVESEKPTRKHCSSPKKVHSSHGSSSSSKKSPSSHPEESQDNKDGGEENDQLLLTNLNRKRAKKPHTRPPSFFAKTTPRPTPQCDKFEHAIPEEGEDKLQIFFETKTTDDA